MDNKIALFASNQKQIVIQFIDTNYNWQLTYARSKR